MNNWYSCSENDTLGTSSAKQLKGLPRGGRGAGLSAAPRSQKHRQGLVSGPAFGNKADSSQEWPKDGGSY